MCQLVESSEEDNVDDEEELSLLFEGAKPGWYTTWVEVTVGVMVRVLVAVYEVYVGLPDVRVVREMYIVSVEVTVEFLVTVCSCSCA